MTIIRANSGVVTQINVFTVPVGGQQMLIDVLTEAIMCAREEPGWLSANLHKSLDGTRIVNYAQSESAAAADAIIGRLKRAGFLDRNKAYGEAHPGLYEVVATFSR
jgi:Antibiotic biosynthesis monooxygenase